MPKQPVPLPGKPAVDYYTGRIWNVINDGAMAAYAGGELPDIGLAVFLLERAYVAELEDPEPVDPIDLVVRQEQEENWLERLDGPFEEPDDLAPD